MENVWVVTEYFINTSTEPIVSVFNNEDAAQSYIEKLQSWGKTACIDKCPIYTKLSIKGGETK